MLRLSRLFVSTATLLGTALVFALMLLFWPNSVFAATITVDGTTCMLPDAITAANSDVATGSCTPGSGDDILLLAPITHVLTTTLSTDNGNTGTPAITSTITISGGIAGATIERSGSDQYRLFYVATGGHLTLEHMTLYNGYSDSDGGAIYNADILTLLDGALISNTATYRGGGIVNFGTAMLTDSTVDANTAVLGGGLYNESNSTATLTNIQFLSNAAYYGGGIANYGTAMLTNMQIFSNTATEGGGFFTNGTATLTGSTVGSNTATHNGGGLYIGSTATLTNTQILSNTAEASGGGLYNDGTATLTGSMVRSNMAT